MSQTVKLERGSLVFHEGVLRNISHINNDDTVRLLCDDPEHPDYDKGSIGCYHISRVEDATKAINQGEGLVKEFLDKRYSIELAKKEALKKVDEIEAGINTIPNANILMKAQLAHMNNLRVVIEWFIIPKTEKV